MPGGRIVVDRQAVAVNVARSRVPTLKDKPDNVLEDMILKAFAYTDKKDEREGPTLSEFFGIPKNHPEFLYNGMAAKIILSERKGQEYVRNLLGYRSPVTFREKFRYFFTGELPLYRSQHHL